MQRVNIRYDDNTTVDANNLGDALVHLVAQGTAGVVDVVEEPSSPDECKHCHGTGREKPDAAKRVLTRKQAEDMVAEVNERVPPEDAVFDERVKAARSVAKNH